MPHLVYSPIPNVPVATGAIGSPHFSNPKGWTLVAAIVAAGYYWRGAKGAALLGAPALVVLGFTSASAGDAMFQFLPPKQA